MAVARQAHARQQHERHAVLALGDVSRAVDGELGPRDVDGVDRDVEERQVERGEEGLEHVVHEQLDQVPDQLRLLHVALRQHVTAEDLEGPTEDVQPACNQQREHLDTNTRVPPETSDPCPSPAPPRS